jgi:hypothetical protein
VKGYLCGRIDCLTAGEASDLLNGARQALGIMADLGRQGVGQQARLADANPETLDRLAIDLSRRGALRVIV